MVDREAYDGPKRRLVLAFDLGTTFSGVSYAILDPGRPPKIMTVSRYPGQEAGDSKIPTILHYDQRGNLLAAGAEEPQIEEDEEDEWMDEPLKLEWFKLLLRPTSLAHSSDIPSPKLPASKTIVDVYADFYNYLFTCARSFIQQAHAALGGLMWNSVKNDIDFILSHPNGWGGAQQSAMRRSAVRAGLVPNTPSGHSRITFVTEGEASLHYCISSGLVSEEIKAGNKVMIVDAGGGTVDISTYMFKATSPVEVEEVTVPACLFEGSVIVRGRAETHIEAQLRNSTKFGNESYVKAIADEFDKTAKKRFKGTGDASVKFSNLMSDKDPAFGIRNGVIKLSRDDVCGFFDPGVTAIIDAVRNQRRSHGKGSGANDVRYLFDKLRTHLTSDEFTLYRPDGHTNKAVAEGAVSFHLDHYVSARVSSLTYGVECVVEYDSTRSSHRKRERQVFKDISGIMVLDNSFTPILYKGTQVSETEEFREPLYFSDSSTMKNTTVEVNILAHPRPAGELPEFVDNTYRRLLQISGYLQGVPSAQRKRPDGGNYSEQRVDVVFSFGLTELKVQLAWTRKGVEQRSPATVLYDDDFAVTVSG